MEKTNVGVGWHVDVDEVDGGMLELNFKLYGEQAQNFGLVVSKNEAKSLARLLIDVAEGR
jgi:hypothetical protein